MSGRLLYVLINFLFLLLWLLLLLWLTLLGWGLITCWWRWRWLCLGQRALLVLFLNRCTSQGVSLDSSSWEILLIQIVRVNILIDIKRGAQGIFRQLRGCNWLLFLEFLSNSHSWHTNGCWRHRLSWLRSWGLDHRLSSLRTSLLDAILGLLNSAGQSSITFERVLDCCFWVVLLIVSLLDLVHGSLVSITQEIVKAGSVTVLEAWFIV